MQSRRVRNTGWLPYAPLPVRVLEFELVLDAVGMQGTMGRANPPRTLIRQARNMPYYFDCKGEILERETRLELATSTLARLRSTN